MVRWVETSRLVPRLWKIATADFMIRSAYMEEEYSHKVENFKKTVERRAEEMNE